MTWAHMNILITMDWHRPGRLLQGSYSLPCPAFPSLPQIWLVRFNRYASWRAEPRRRGEVR